MLGSDDEIELAYKICQGHNGTRTTINDKVVNLIFDGATGLENLLRELRMM